MRGPAPSTTGAAGPAGDLTLRRGDCPSVHEPWEQEDGALVRVRVPGGFLSAAQLRALAGIGARTGAALTVTNRANLQLRGLDAAAAAAVRDALVDAGLALADGAADARRNVVASPTAGVDALEAFDTRPLVAAVAGRLASAPGGLPAKFGVLVDGGGAVNLRGRRQDLCLGARQGRGGAGPSLEVRVAGELPRRDTASGIPVVAPADGVALAVAAIDLLARGADARRPEPTPMADLVARHGPADVLEQLARQAGVALRHATPDELVAPPISRRPIGALAEHRADRMSVGAMPLLGHLDAAALAALAEGLPGADGGALRLTPWRSVLLPGVAQRAVPDALAALSALGLAVDPEDPAVSVVACAGRTGCPAGCADTQADAVSVIDALRGRRGTTGDRAISVHLSGCPKRCADRSGEHDVTLIAGPLPDTYRLGTRTTGESAEGPGAPSGDPVPAARVVAAVLAAAPGPPR